MKYFCPLPWNSIELKALGYYGACCLSKIITHEGSRLSVRDHNIDQARNSDSMTQLRKDFLDGKKPPECNKCWSVEDSGQLSKRNHAIIKFGIPTQLGEKPNALQFLDLKAGNICNIKCRICGGHASSKWLPELIALSGGEVAKSFKLERIDGNWPQSNMSTWDQISESLESIIDLEISGGEPFLIQKQFDVLEEAIKRGYSKNISIHYNTNGTIYPEKALTEIWPHFARVEIAFSIDDIGERFEYQRFPAKWAEVDENVTRINNLRKNSHWLTTQACCTVNKQNIYYLPEVTDYILSKKFNFWHFNMMYGPEEFTIFSLENQVKEKCASRIMTMLKDKLKYQSHVVPVINFMMQPGQVLDKEFLSKISTHDRYRDQDFSKTFPEFYKVLTNG